MIKTQVDNDSGIDDGYLKTACIGLFRDAKLVIFGDMNKKSTKKALFLQPKK